MRRIASVLSARQSDKSDRRQPPDHLTPSPSSPCPPSNPSLGQPHRKPTRRFFGTLARISVSTDRPKRPSVLSEPGHSSSASSTGSVSLRTPDDDRVGHLAPHDGRASGRRAWIPWLTPKKSDMPVPLQRPSSFWSDSMSPIPSPTAPPVPSGDISGQPTESDEDTSEESSSSESEASSLSPPTLAKSDLVNPKLPSIDFLKTLTTNNVPLSFSSPPLLHHPNAPAFPRSSNRSRSLPFRATMESTMHRNRLLHYLQRGHLTATDRRILESIGARPSSAAQRKALVQTEEGERYDLKHLRSSSLGLKKWIARPYFEERFVAWLPDEAGTVVWTTVKGSGFGVWALEVSDTIELMAGLTDVEDPLPIGTLEPPLLNNSPVSSPSLTPVGKYVPYKAVPSPLGGDCKTSDPPMPSSSEVVTPAETSTLPPARRGVRFAENVDVDKDDAVPLGYILRHRKRREEKTLFLQRERERREHEEEKLRHEAERQQWEQEKRQWQKEKRTVEGAKRQKQFAEEITAARVRRESLYAIPSSQPKEQERKAREAYSRPTYDPRRQTESPSQTRPPHSRNDSSSSSKQGSLHQSESAGPIVSRPASTYSAVSEDVRTRVSRNSRRASIISESQRSVISPVYTYGWPPVPPMPQVLPMPVYPAVQTMPMVPQFPLDMPLLPPTAPFMRQQYGRSPSSSKATGQSHSAERPQHPNDRSSTLSSHRRSNSDEAGGHNSPRHSRTQANTSLTLHRPPYPRHAHSSDPSSHRVPITTSLAHKPVRRQTAIS